MTAKQTTKPANKPAAKTANKGANKSAAVKTAKPAAKQAPAVVAPAAPVETYAHKLARVIEERNKVAPSKDLDHARSVITKGVHSINALYAKPDYSDVLDALCKQASESEKNKPAFIAVKVLVKVAHAMIAIASGVRSEFDPYSRTIIANLSKLSGVTNKSALVCLSKSVTYDALDQQQALSAVYNCSVGTATTQASSTRMMLRALGLCAVEKGKRGDVTRTLENARCAQLLSMFAAE